MGGSDVEAKAEVERSERASDSPRATKGSVGGSDVEEKAEVER